MFISVQRQIYITGILELQTVDNGERWFCLWFIGYRHAPKQAYLRFWGTQYSLISGLGDRDASKVDH